AVALNDQHRRVIDALSETGFTTVWVPDHHLLQTHTCAFDKIMKERRDELGLVGVFETISPGSNPGEANCFAFPTPDGGWTVYLFGQGRVEARTWNQDGTNWTTCDFNRPP